MRKTEYEAINVNSDFVAGMKIKDGEVLSEYSIDVTDKDGTAVTGMIENDSIVEDTRVGFRVTGGSISASPYVVSVKADTSLDQKLEIRDEVIIY